MDNERLLAVTQELLALQWSEEAITLGIRQDFKCIYCERDLLRSIEDYDSWNCDHVVPLTKQGQDVIENKVIACKLCNFVKRSFDPRPHVGPNPSTEDLVECARDYVAKGRSAKQKSLEEVKAVLIRAGLVSPQRFKKTGE